MTDIEDVLLVDQKKGQTDNTTAREAVKEQAATGWELRFAIGIALLSIIFFLAIASNWNFFWSLAIGAGVYYAGSKLSGVKAAKDIIWIWPLVIELVGISLIVLTLATSGFVKLLAVRANKVETAASCAADPNQARCEANEENRVGIYTGKIIRLASEQPIALLIQGEKKVYPGACHKISINAAEGAIETNWDHIPAGYGIIIAKKLTEVTLTAIRDTKYPGC